VRLVGLVKRAEQEAQCALSVLKRGRAGGAVRLVGLEERGRAGGAVRLVGLEVDAGL
jgi:hypothetical protein